MWGYQISTERHNRMGTPGCRLLEYCIVLPVMCGVPLLFPLFFYVETALLMIRETQGGPTHTSLHSKYDAIVHIWLN